MPKASSRSSYISDLSIPFDGYTITASDAEILPRPVSFLNIAVTGNVRVRLVSDQVITVNIAAGILFPLQVKQVFATGTDAVGVINGFL